MRERPILFNGDMVRAILAGQKSQTRRVVKPQPPTPEDVRALAGIDYCWLPPSWPGAQHHRVGGPVWAVRKLMGQEPEIVCPFGQPGDRLWVRESFRIGEDLGEDWEDGIDVGDRFPIYQADGEHGRYGVVPLEWDPPRNAREVHNSEGTAEHWRSFGPIPSIHMPRWACRLVLEITAVRVERLHQIGHSDALSEGYHLIEVAPGYDLKYSADPITWAEIVEGNADAYNDPRHAFRDQWTSTGGDWDSNPWVWVIEFKRVEVQP